MAREVACAARSSAMGGGTKPSSSCTRASGPWSRSQVEARLLRKSPWSGLFGRRARLERKRRERRRESNPDSALPSLAPRTRNALPCRVPCSHSPSWEKSCCGLEPSWTDEVTLAQAVASRTVTVLLKGTHAGGGLPRRFFFCLMTQAWANPSHLSCVVVEKAVNRSRYTRPGAPRKLKGVGLTPGIKLTPPPPGSTRASATHLQLSVLVGLQRHTRSPLLVMTPVMLMNTWDRGKGQGWVGLLERCRCRGWWPSHPDFVLHRDTLAQHRHSHGSHREALGVGESWNGHD